MEFSSRQDETRSHAAVGMHAKHFEILAAVGAADLARSALLAIHVRFDRALIAGLNVGYTSASPAWGLAASFSSKISKSCGLFNRIARIQAPRLGVNKDTLQMSIERILRDVLRDHRFETLQGVGKPRFHLSRHFVADVQQLAEVRIVLRRRLIVAKRRRIL